jgi:branched-chain amino acid transport system permease protein
VGGFATAVLSTRAALPPAVTIPLAAALGAAAGALFSALTLRLHHWFFAVTTLALSVAAVSGVGQFDVLGGPLGLAGIPLVAAAWPIVLSLAVAFAVAVLLDRSGVGLAIRATGDDQGLAQVFGVRVKNLRVVIFALGAAMAALSGALHAHRFGVYQPTDLGFHPSLLLFLAVIVGGKNSVYGPLVGTFFLFIVPELVHITPETELIVFGGFMILVAVAFPDGLVGALQAGVALILRRSPRRGLTSREAA